MGLFGELSFNDNCDNTNNQYPHPMAADTPRYVSTLWIDVSITNVVVGSRDIPWCVRRGDGMTACTARRAKLGTHPNHRPPFSIKSREKANNFAPDSNKITKTEFIIM